MQALHQRNRPFVDMPISVSRPTIGGDRLSHEVLLDDVSIYYVHLLGAPSGEPISPLKPVVEQIHRLNLLKHDVG